MVLTAQLLNPSPPQARLYIRAADQGIRPLRPSTPAQIKQVQHRLSDEKVAQLVLDYLDGHSVSELVQQYRIHRNTVLDHLKRQGIARRPTVRKLSDAQVEEASQLYRQGWSLVKVGDHFQVDDETVRTAFKRAAIAIRPRRGWKYRGGSRS